MSVKVSKCVRANQRDHSPLKGEPAGYVAWDEWAGAKIKTHEQHYCPDCGRFAIWKPKAKR